MISSYSKTKNYRKQNSAIQEANIKKEIEDKKKEDKNDNRRKYISSKYHAIINAVLIQLEKENANFDINSSEGIKSIERVLESSSLCDKIYGKEDIPELINAVRRRKNAENQRDEK